MHRSTYLRYEGNDGLRNAQAFSRSDDAIPVFQMSKKEDKLERSPAEQNITMTETVRQSPLAKTALKAL